MSWTWNKDYKDLSQVEEFYPAYMAVYSKIVAAGQYPYNDSFTGRISGIVGPDEGRAIYMLQTLRSVREMEAKVTEHLADGWRELKDDELESGPVRYSGIAEYAFYMGGTGWYEWSDARLRLYGQSSTMVLPGRNRSNGHLITGKILVKDK